jgi:hypothetical protein
MKIIKRDAIAARIAAGEALEGFAVRSMRPFWERRAIEPADVDRVRAALGEDAAAGRIVPFMASTPERADDGIVLPTKGCDLERFGKNPVVFWQHMSWSSRPRIADAVMWVDGEAGVRALVSFMQRDLSQALDNGFSWALGELAGLRGHACSIGFDILSAIPAPEDVRRVMPWAIDAVSWRMLELSLVNLPADENAVSEGRAAGVDVEPLAVGFGRMLDELEGSGIDRGRIERAWAAATTRRTTSLPPVLEPPREATSAEIVAAIRDSFGQLPQP